MLCYRCGSHVPDTSESCPTCGQKLAGGGVRQATGTFSRRKLNASWDGSPLQPGEVVAGRYVIRDALGAGPVGFVWRVTDRESETDMALKMIHSRLLQTEEERAQFLKVLKGAKKLNHPNLVRVFEVGEAQETVYYTMPFLDGLTLRKIIDLRLGKSQLFTVRELEPIIAQLAQALDAAHAVGPHTDFKPENVIVLPDLLKVSDFGLGLALPRVPFIQAQKSRHAESYLSPEYIEGAEVDARSDVYGLGVIIGEMLGGQRPDGSVPELLERNPELPPALEGLYRKALNSNPTARFETARALLEEFTRSFSKTSRETPKAKAEGSRPTPPAQRLPSAPGISSSESGRRARISAATAPPVPTEALPHRPPPDATQPMDSSELPEILAAMAQPKPKGRAQTEETEVVRSYENAAPYDTRTTRLPKAAPRVRSSPRFPVWLLLAPLILLGLVLGSGLGYLALESQRKRDESAVAEPTPEEVVKAQAALREEARRTEEVRLQEEARRIEAAKQAEAARKAEEAKAEEIKRQEELARLEELRKSNSSENNRKNRSNSSGGKREDSKRDEGRKDDGKPEKVASAIAPVTPTADEGCPEGMKMVAAGPFKMGTGRDDPMMGFDEKLLAVVTLEAYCIDQYEFPNRRGALPQINVGWGEAKRLCEARSRRLCTEEEWEKACKGPGNARFPYGNGYDADVCNTEDSAGEDRGLAASGFFSRCRSGYGVADLSGNVFEWTASSYAGGSEKAQKGGAYDKLDSASRCSARKSAQPSSKAPEVGFRCCASLK